VRIEPGDAPVRASFPGANFASLSDGSSTCATNSIPSLVVVAPTTALRGRNALVESPSYPMKVINPRSNANVEKLGRVTSHHCINLVLRNASELLVDPFLRPGE